VDDAHVMFIILNKCKIAYSLNFPQPRWIETSHLARPHETSVIQPA
jgi:hypothetical protein